MDHEEEAQEAREGLRVEVVPSKTARQRRAMAAACYGKSTLGIPKRVGCEFSRHDMAKAKGHTRPGKHSR